METIPRVLGEMETIPLLHHKSTIEKLNEIIQKIGYGRYHRNLFLLCGFGWLIDNLWLQILAICLTHIQEEFHLSTQSSPIATTSTLAGSLFWGVFADTFGRKPAFNYTLIISALFGLLSSFQRDVYLFCLVFFFAGFGLGGNLPVDGSIFLEFCPASHQHRLVLMSIFWPVGQIIASILGWIFIDSWRNIILTGGLITMTLWLGRFFVFRMFESPKFLIKNNRIHECCQVLNNIIQYNKITNLTIHIEDFEPEISSINSSFDSSISQTSTTPLSQTTDASSISTSTIIKPLAISTSKAAFEKYLADIKILFSPQLFLTTILTWLIWGFASLAYTMYYAFLPKFLSQTPPLFSPQTDFFIISTFGIPGSITGMYLINIPQLGRRKTMTISTIITSISILLFTVFQKTTPEYALIANCVAAFWSNVMYGVLYAYTPEVFPTKVRGTGCGVAGGVGRLVGVFAPFLAGVLLEVGVGWALGVAAGGFLVVGVVCLGLPVETLGGVVM